MRKPLWLLMAAVPTVVGLGIAAFVVTRAQHSLDRAGEVAARQGSFPMELRKIARQENPGFEAIRSPATYTSGAFFHGKLYVSGPGGISIFGAPDLSRPNGNSLLKSYRVGQDLPAATPGQMVVGRLRGDSEQELMIATAGAGILLFSPDGSADGSGSFRQIYPQDKEARDVTALLPLPTGELLIGTRKRGLLVYRGLAEGKAIETFHSALANLSITVLAADQSGIWVGTHDQGVRHWHGGQIDSFVAKDGLVSGSDASASLPDGQVDAIALHGERAYVGTPLGVEEFIDGQPSRTLAHNLFAHALYADAKELTVGSMDEGIGRVSLDVSRHRAGGSRDFDGVPDRRSETRPDGNSSSAEAFLRADNGGAADGDLYAVMHDGVSRLQTGGQWTPIVSSPSTWQSTRPATTGIQGETLTDGNISALAFDPDGRLWVGYFDRGLDVLSTQLQRSGHYEDDRLFCINRIVLNPHNDVMAVATANGLVLMNPHTDLKKPRQVMTRRDGLIADHVTDVAFSGATMVVATPAGLSFVDGMGVRSLYAFEGLVNNHVYALGIAPTNTRLSDAKDASPGSVLAGTLGGVSKLRRESIEQNLTVANSGLKHNWVTAIVATGEPDTWFVGTYGAGVMRLDKDGRFTPMDGATGAMEVNPNAMLATSAHILAGTLGDGLWVWSRSRSRWRQITAGLPSENVTALAEHAGEIYVGTENGLVRIAESVLD